MISLPPTSSVSPSSSIGSQLLDNDKDEGVVVVGMDVEDRDCSNCNTTTSGKKMKKRTVKEKTTTRANKGMEETGCRRLLRKMMLNEQAREFMTTVQVSRSELQASSLPGYEPGIVCLQLLFSGRRLFTQVNGSMKRLLLAFVVPGRKRRRWVAGTSYCMGYPCFPFYARIV